MAISAPQWNSTASHFLTGWGQQWCFVYRVFWTPTPTPRNASSLISYINNTASITIYGHTQAAQWKHYWSMALWVWFLCLTLQVKWARFFFLVCLQGSLFVNSRPHICSDKRCTKRICESIYFLLLAICQWSRFMFALPHTNYTLHLYNITILLTVPFVRIM